ncbi:MAG: DUF58 domain-containing protein [Chloroflexi bacterium]|nr:DUF58 domain-containing protein [Chloroflexota bacterium]
MRHFLPYFFLLFLLAAFLRIDFFFIIAYFFFAIYLLSRLWMNRIERGLRVSRRFNSRAFFGDKVNVEINVINDSWLPAPWIELRESLPIELATPSSFQQVVSLGGRGRRQLNYTLHCHHRGYYSLGPLQAHTGDLLGLADKDLKRSAEYIVVYPRMVSMQQLGLPTRSPLAILKTPTPLFEDSSRVIGVREYQRGDSPRKIHWTASASAGQLLVKNYQPAIARETLIALDLDYASYPMRHRYSAIEMAITTAASIANHAIVHQHLPTGIASEHILESLARVQAVEGVTPFAELLRRESVHLSWGTTLLVITARVDDTLLKTLAYLQRSGFAVALIMIHFGRVPLEIQAKADVLGIKVYAVWDDFDLRSI